MADASAEGTIEINSSSSSWTSSSSARARDRENGDNRGAGASVVTPRSSAKSLAYEGYGSYNPTNQNRANKNPEQIVFWDSAAQRPKENISGLRTWNGVFLPVTTGILGVVLFLKMPFIVAQCGLFLVIGLLVGCYFVSGMTTLSIAALSTNGFVGEGGPYYLSSRVLGAANGVAVGVSFLVGNLLTGAFFVTGSSNFALRVLHSDSVKDWANENPYSSTIATASVLLLLLLVVSMVGMADWFRIVTLLAIVIATVDVIVTCFGDYAIGVHGLTGFSWRRMGENLWPDFTPDMDLASAVGTVFPSVGGILSGMTMSGEIRNASKGIPRGIGYALITTFIFYLVVTFFIAGSFDRSVLRLAEGRSLMDVTKVYVYVPGALLSCFAAALSNLVGSSRVLYAMAQDNLIPRVRLFAYLRTLSKRECVLVCWIIMQVAILAIGTQYTSASIVGSLVLLSSYLALNVGCLLSSVSGVVSFRPVYHFFSEFTALVAACSCFIGMFVIHPLGAATIICLHVLCQFLVGTYMDPSKITWGDASQPLTFFLVRKLLLQLDERKEHIRHWRPSLLHVITDFHVSHNLIHFCNNIKKGGLYELFHVLEGDFHSTAGSCHLWKRWTIDFIAASGMKAFAVIAFGDSIRAAVQQAIRDSGLGAMRPNSIMLSLDELDNQNFHRVADEPSCELLHLYNLHRLHHSHHHHNNNNNTNTNNHNNNNNQGTRPSGVSSTLSVDDGEVQREKYRDPTEANFVRKAGNLLSLGARYQQTAAKGSRFGFSSGEQTGASAGRFSCDGKQKSSEMQTLLAHRHPDEANDGDEDEVPEEEAIGNLDRSPTFVIPGAGSDDPRKFLQQQRQQNSPSSGNNRAASSFRIDQTMVLNRSPTFFVHKLNKVLQARTRPKTEQDKKPFSASLNEKLGTDDDVQVLMKNLRLHRDVCIFAGGVDSLTYQDGDQEFSALAHDITHLHLNLFIARNFWKLDSHRLNTGSRDSNPFYIDLVSPDPSDAVIFLSAYCLCKTAVWKRVARLRVVDFVARSVDVDDAMAARRHMLKLRRIEADVKVVAFDDLPKKAKGAIDKIFERRMKLDEDDVNDEMAGGYYESTLNGEGEGEGEGKSQDYEEKINRRRTSSLRRPTKQVAENDSDDGEERDRSSRRLNGEGISNKNPSHQLSPPNPFLERSKSSRQSSKLGASGVIGEEYGSGEYNDIGSDTTEASRGSDIGNIRRALATPHHRSLIVNCIYKNYEELTDRTAVVFARVPCFKAGKFTEESSVQWMREVRTISHGMPPMLMCCGEGALVTANDW